MALSKFLDPKNDIAFKRVFGSENHKDILIHFINDILELKGNEQIVSMSIKSVPLICTKSVPAIIKIFTSFSLRFFKLFHTITFTFNIEDRCIVH